MARTLLIADDNALNRRLLTHTLCHDYTIIEAKNGAEALTVIRQKYKLLSAVLLDIQMPEMDGYEVLRKMRENPVLAQLPVIMVTGSEGEASRVKALELGANDFITKPYNPDIVRHCLRNNITLRETASIVNAIQRDRLTGLYIREFFFEKVAAMIKEKEPGYYILSCFDIDGFKLINDQFGAMEGDRVLREVGHGLSRDMELFGGVGGRISADNFAALYPADQQNTDFIQRLQQDVGLLERQNIAFSVGRYLITDLSLSVSAIYDRAYIAKRSVKGRYDRHMALFDKAMLDKLIRDQQITGEMESALKNRQFEAWFQPQYDHATGAMIGAEALVRWRHPDKGIIPPGDFIPLFEQSGFIYELDKYMWREVCSLLRSWMDAGLRPLPVSVNISRYDIFRSDLIDVLSDLVREYDLPATLLRLEITESAFSSSTAMIVKIVKQLIALGFTVEIDDFGSGYSSLNTLKNVPAQVVKMDMRFLGGDEEDARRGGSILESIVRMAKWLGMAVLAEGVEEIAQADFLKSIGCTYIQGYLYARPMPVADYEALLRGDGATTFAYALENVNCLGNDAFWDPKSIDSLVFNSYAGGACVFEYRRGQIEMIRITDKFVQTVFGAAFSSSDALRLDWFAHFSDDAREAMRASVERSAQTHAEATCELLLLALPGCVENTYLQTTVRVLASTDDRRLVYCTCVNVTAQRLAEHNELEIARRLQTIMSTIEGGVVISQIENGIPVIRFSNARYYNLFGYDKASYEAAFQDGLGPILPEDATAVVDGIEAVMRTGVGNLFDFRARKQDGSIIWIRDRVVRMTDAGYAAQLSVLYDVTAQKTAEERLRISEEENRLALEQSGTLVCRFDIPTRTLSVPPRANSIFGVASTLPGLPESALDRGDISPETVEDYASFYHRILQGDKTAEALFQRKSSAGWRWLEAHASTVFTEDGKPATAVISFVDATERLEKELAYELRTRALQEKDPASYILYTCNISREDGRVKAVGGAMPHADFPADTVGLKASSELYARTRVMEADRKAYLNFVNIDAMLASFTRGKLSNSFDFRELLPGGDYHWLRLTVDLAERPNRCGIEAHLMFEDIDAWKRDALKMQERAETDPLTGLYNRKTFVEKFERVMAEKPHALSALFIIDLDSFKQVNDHFGHAIGDETLIEMGQKLRCVFREQDLVCRLGGDEYMVLMCDLSNRNAVSDKAALVCALLHKSFSIDVQLSTSIGIAICPDDGTDFSTLYHKVDRALYHVKGTGKDGYALYDKTMEDELIAAPETPPAAAAPGEVYAAPKRRMLIVEDNEVNRDFLAALFEEEFIVDTAAEGTAALTRLRRYGAGISIVLLDLVMPGMDGFAVLDQMRESPVMQSIPVIVVSGMDDRETSLEAIRHGASDFITKPVDAELLRIRVGSALGRAENERLRAQNHYLSLQNDEAKRLAEAKRHSEELSVALHAAERADLAKSQFLSSMSHEIRTPLNAVIGYNTIARGEMSGAHTDEERRQADMRVLDCLTKSEVASRHLLTIINDVLDMSAIESGKMKVEHAPFDFRSLITSLTVMFFAQARAKGVGFEVLFHKPTEEWFVGDQMRINQILTNLLSNAVKFTPAGGNVTLSITERAPGEQTTGFRFVVSDTGIGMTPDYLGHIWTPFEQAEASISRRFGGTGLGLSITKNLVDLMEGTIAVESTPGVGSTFTVDLTLERTAQPDKQTSYDFSHVNALVVDDDPNTCDYIKLLFDRCGARCTALTSGRQAVAAFAEAKERHKPFNICLIDWRMPEMDGFKTISEIRRVAAKQLPIVVVTAYDFTEVADQAGKLGINRFISKPLFQSSLFDLLANISGKQVADDAGKKIKYDFGGARVLLAEDNNMNMEVARRILLSAKINVDSAWNGQEAVDIFTASRPGTYKAILMDVHMPVVDGYQATWMIRNADHPDARAIPIIAMTADVFAEDIAASKNAGMNDHIAKPIDIENLFKTLERYMEEEE